MQITMCITNFTTYSAICLTVIPTYFRSINMCVCVCVYVCVQVIDFSQHHLELVSKEEYKRPAARQSSSKEYGLIRMKEER